YRALTFFFEGVPAPGESGDLAAALAQQQRPPPVSFHKAFREGRCAECHLDKKRFLKEAIPELCWQCHPRPTDEKPWRHAPARVGDCMACHVGHESASPYLLTTVGKSLCFSCHRDSHIEQLPPHAGEHLARCAECHHAHEGGTHPRDVSKPNADKTSGD
ncbi:hypothetical protein FJY63_14330, partial [Candidatus Sumerlaeota bacterium]|nr:hypothetical protein [Candidatus Sumerlaeota bacterium]